MDIQEIKEETVRNLGLQFSDVNYITKQFINQQLQKSRPLFQNENFIGEKPEELEDIIKHGNSIWIDDARYHWSQNAEGTPDYACGIEQAWSVGKLLVRSVKKKGKCKEGKKWYQLKIIDFRSKQ